MKQLAAASALVAVLACGKGSSSSTPAAATRPNSPPTAGINVSPQAQAIVAVTPVALAAIANDADGDALTFTWDFGDGVKGTGQNTTHVYAREGAFTIILTVTDGRGGSTTVNATVTVRSLSGSWHSAARGYYFDLRQDGTRITGLLVGYTPGPVYYRNPFPLTGTVAANREVSFALNVDGGFNFLGTAESVLDSITGTLRDGRSYGDILRRIN